MSRQKRNPLRTRNGKLKLGPLSQDQLIAARDSAVRPKEKNKIQNRINNRIKAVKRECKRSR